MRRVAGELLGEEPSSVLLVNSWRGDFSTVAGLVFRSRAARPVLAFKAATVAALAEAVRTEARNLETLAGGFAPSFPDSVPRPLKLVAEGEVTLLVESVVEGSPIRPPSGALWEPWLEGLLERVVLWLEAFHAAAGSAPHPLVGEEFETLVLGPFVAYLANFSTNAAERGFLEAMMKQAEGLRGQVLPVVPQHGDFCAANVFVGPASAVGVIDWEEPFFPSLPLMDLLHFVSSAGLSGEARLDGDGLALFRAVFLDPGPLKRVVTRAVHRAGRRQGLDAGKTRVLAARYWVAYALEKLAAMRRWGQVPISPEKGPSDPAPSALNAFSSARFEDGACLNLRLMAARSEEFLAA